MIYVVGLGERIVAYEEADAYPVEDKPEWMFVGRGFGQRIAGTGKWFRNEEEAQVAARKLRDRQVAALKKKMERLQKMERFPVVQWKP